MKKMMIAGLAAAMMSSPVMAEVVLPNTFVSGTSASAQDVNDNFAALKAAIEALQDEVAALKSRDVTGNTYEIYDLEVGVNRYDGDPNSVASNSGAQLGLKQAKTILAFHEGGTATWNLPFEENILFDMDGATIYDRESLTEGPETMYWSQNGSELSLYEDAAHQELAIILTVSEGANTLLTGDSEATDNYDTGATGCYDEVNMDNSANCYQDGLDSALIIGLKL